MSTSSSLNPRSGTPIELAFRWKCLNELAFYTIFLDHLGFTDDRDALAAVVDQFLDGVLADIALRSSHRMLMFTFVLSRMLRHRLVDGTRLRRIETYLNGPFAWGDELPAHRQLDIVTACVYANVRPPLSHSLIVSVSSIVLPPCPVVSGRDAFYALCHSLLFAEVLEYRVPQTNTLLEVLDGAACRALASEDFDLGLELVAAALSARLPLTEAMRRIVIDVINQLDSVGLAQKDVGRFSAIKTFVETKPAERDWAASFHLMLTAGLALSMLQQRNVDLIPPTGAREDVWRLGHAMLGLHRNAVTESLSYLRGYTAVTYLGRTHLRRIVRYINSLQQDNGAFGLLAEERALMSSLSIKGDFDRNIERPLNEACQEFLAHFSAT